MSAGHFSLTHQQLKSAAPAGLKLKSGHGSTPIPSRSCRSVLSALGTRSTHIPLQNRYFASILGRDTCGCPLTFCCISAYDTTVGHSGWHALKVCSNGHQLRGVGGSETIGLHPVPAKETSR